MLKISVSSKLGDFIEKFQWLLAFTKLFKGLYFSDA